MLRTSIIFSVCFFSLTCTKINKKISKKGDEAASDQVKKSYTGEEDAFLKTSAQCLEELKNQLYTGKLRGQIPSIHNQDVTIGFNDNSLEQADKDGVCSPDRLRLPFKKKIDYYKLKVTAVGYSKEYTYTAGLKILPYLEEKDYQIEIRGCIDEDDIRTSSSLKVEIESCAAGDADCYCTKNSKPYNWKPSFKNCAADKKKLDELFDYTHKTLRDKSNTFRAKLFSYLDVCNGIKDAKAKTPELQGYAFAICGIFLNYGKASFAEVLELAFLPLRDSLASDISSTSLALSQDASNNKCYNIDKSASYDGYVADVVGGGDPNSTTSSAAAATASTSDSNAGFILSLASAMIVVGAIFLSYSIKEKFYNNGSLIYWADERGVLGGLDEETALTPRKKYMDEATKKMSDDIVELDRLNEEIKLETNTEAKQNLIAQRDVQVAKVSESSKNVLEQIDTTWADSPKGYVSKRALKSVKAAGGGTLLSVMEDTQRLAQQFSDETDLAMKDGEYVKRAKKLTDTFNSDADSLRRALLSTSITEDAELGKKLGLLNDTQLLSLDDAFPADLKGVNYSQPGDFKVTVGNKLIFGMDTKVRQRTWNTIVAPKDSRLSKARVSQGVGALLGAGGFFMMAFTGLAQSSEAIEFKKILLENTASFEVILKEINTLKRDLRLRRD